jgi:hypothetical protein
MQPVALIAKLTADGALDPSFNGTETLHSRCAAADISIDAAGNAIFIGGRFCCRITATGTLIRALARTRTKAMIGIGAAGLDLQPDGKIVFGGTSGRGRDPGGAVSPAAMDSDLPQLALIQMALRTRLLAEMDWPSSQ